MKLEKLWSHVFTTVVPLTQRDTWYRKLREAIDREQNQAIWISETKVNTGTPGHWTTVSTQSCRVFFSRDFSLFNFRIYLVEPNLYVVTNYFYLVLTILMKYHLVLLRYTLFYRFLPSFT